ncbi:MAG: type II secretion system F family protein, partial [Nitrospirales bacterium]
ELPWATQLLLNFVEGMKRWLPWMVLGGIGLAAIVGKWAQTARGRWWLDRMSLSLPFVGDVLLKNQIVRMARTLSTIIAGGIPLLNAMQITSGAITNRVIAEALRRATDRFREGFGFAAALREQGFLPPMTLEMIEVGETTGSLDLMLQDVAEFHEGELDLRLGQLTTWIEPALIVLMGIVVGGIVIIMYLPIFHIAGTV